MHKLCLPEPGQVDRLLHSAFAHRAQRRLFVLDFGPAGAEARGKNVCCITGTMGIDWMDCAVEYVCCSEADCIGCEGIL
jgi:hypothetical protein